MKRWIGIILLLVIVVSFVGCVGKDTTDKNVLTVSIPPQKYLLERIVGDKYEINSMLAPGVNPENYDPSMNHLVGLQKSKAYFRVGNLGFESAVLPKINENFPELRIYSSSVGISLIYGTHSHCENGHDHHHHDAANVDPHMWTSVKNAKIMASNMYKVMVEIDPQNKSYYSKRYEALRKDLIAIDDSITSMLAKHKGETFLVWHPSLSYFARDYGLIQMSVESEGKEASAQQLKQIITNAKLASPKVFFYQKEYDSRQVEMLNKEIGTELVPINLMNYEWEQEMYNVASALATERGN